MTIITALYCSPREGGNSELLMDEFIRGAEEAGAEVKRVYARKLNVSGCLECGGCDETGECIIRDDMDEVYPQFMDADRVVMGTSIFFYGLPAQGKAVVDRCQAMWNRTRLNPELKRPEGKGFFLGLGATKGQNLFEGTLLCFKYWLDALGMPMDYDSLTYRRIEASGAVKDHPTALADAYQAGQAFARE